MSEMVKEAQLIVKERTASAIIAAAAENSGARVFEGNWYFKPENVNMDYLKVTERTYVCPYKGICFWIDAVSPEGQVSRNVGWVYRNPKPGYEFIKDEIGFYARNSAGILVEKS